MSSPSVLLSQSSDIPLPYRLSEFSLQVPHISQLLMETLFSVSLACSFSLSTSSENCFREEEQWVLCFLLQTPLLTICPLPLLLWWVCPPSVFRCPYDHRNLSMALGSPGTPPTLPAETIFYIGFLHPGRAPNNVNGLNQKQYIHWDGGDSNTN